MKRILVLMLSILILSASNSLSAQKVMWNEMEEFHKVMGATFHPAEEGKLDPIKKRSGEMLEKAKAWKRSDVPEGYDKKAVKRSLKELVKGSRKLDKMVKENAPDASLTEKLTSLHDIFHDIMDNSMKKTNP